MIVAIDGPAASGKSTTARKLAEVLKFTHLDTGAMYRAVTLHFLNHQVDLTDPSQIYYHLNQIQIEFTPDRRILLNKKDVTEEIRTPQVDQKVSEVSALPEVRERMVELQRNIARDNDVVVEGRDIGTRVFPNADFKFYMVADPQERARRRYRELVQRGINCNLDEILEELKQRDILDSTRKHSPLKQAEDALVIDTTRLTPDEQVEKIVKTINQKTK